MSHPAVITAKVVGVRDEDGADRDVAYLTVSDAQVTEDLLLSYCRDRVAAFKVPTVLRILQEFPVTAGTNGTKIRTAELRRWASEDLARPGPGWGKP